MRLPSDSRRAVTTVEFAVVAPITFLFLLGLLVGGLGIYRYQQVAHLSREASRWASVHGAQYAADTGNSAATASDVYQNVILPQAAGLDPNKLTYSVTWNTSNSQFHSTTVNGVTTMVHANANLGGRDFLIQTIWPAFNGGCLNTK